MCGGGGGGGSGTQQYNWNPAMEKMWGRGLGYADALLDKPYASYGGQRIAGLNQDQTNAMGLIRNTVASGGLPVVNAANSQAEDTLDDTYLTGNMRNPYAAQDNVYSGMANPYFVKTLEQGMGDLAKSYQQGTAADTTRMFNLSGALGGSAHQNAVANNEAAFGKTLTNYLSGMQNDQYNRSGAMDESRLQRATGAYEGERGRQMGAMSPAQNAQGLFFQGANQVMGIGDAQRSLQQDYLNQGYGDWQDQQNYPNKLLDYFTGILSRAQGGMSPNSTTTMPGYQASPFSSILGGLMAYKGLTG